MSVISMKWTFTPNLQMPWLNRAKVQPYRVSLATISSPASTLDQMAVEIAPMPEAVARAASPPSSSASLASTVATVGLPRRE